MEYYEILGLEKNATEEEIKKAYRKKAKEHHPDKGGDANTFKEISEAYDVLSDSSKRSNYDRFGKDGAQGNGGFNMEDIFSGFGDMFGGFSGFSGFGNRKKKGKDISVNIEVDVNDILFGSTKKVNYKRRSKCNTCDGKGGENVKTCTTCKGAGHQTVYQNTNFGRMQQVVQCNSCNGLGNTVIDTCKTCNGSAVTQHDESIDIPIPGGVSNGINLTMPEFGDFVRGGTYGDLQISIKEKIHSTYKRDGSDLLVYTKISISQAVLGDTLIVDTPHGKMTIELDKGTISGKKFIYTGKGFPKLLSNGSTHGYGNMYIITDIDIPSNLSDDENELFKKIKEYGF